MKTIRVFVSSPGDVQAERTIADRLIRTIAEELTIPVSVQYSNLLRDGEAIEASNGSAQADSGEMMLCPYFWEYQRFSPEMGYQDQIPNTAQFDLVISILWSRLGTKLHPRFQMPDGSEPRSGTEFEIAWARAQHAKTPGIPALHVYRNRGQPNPPLDPPAVREEFFRQWDSLKGFFESWEIDSQGQFVGAFNNYNNLEEFERLFREHFRDFLATQISSEHCRQWLAKRSQARRWKENPFRGLQIFDLEHAPIFAGRTLAIDGVLTAVSQQAEAGRPFVLVLGASGSGKSSLVRAGVLPLLVEPGVIEGIGLWRRSVMRPGAGGSQSDMFDALAAGLLAQEALPELADLESKEPVKDLAAELRANPQGVADRVKDKLNQVASEHRLRQEQRLRELESSFRDQKREADAENARLQREKLEPPRARLALVVDQLEELFTSGFSEELQLKFVNVVSVLARSGRVFVLVTLRNDFYARYQQFTDLVELTKPSGKYDLQPPTPQELGRMIRLPAQAAALEFERDEALGQTLDEALRDSAAADPQALPLLEHVLTRLYELQEKRGDRILSWSDYRELGEMNGALANHAEEVFGTLGEQEQAAFPLVMSYLVTLGQGEEEVPNRRTAPYNDFLGPGGADQGPKAGAKGFVDSFIEKRLLVADTDPHGEITVSVAHEALLREWVRVKSWLAGNREFLRMRDRLDSSLRLWLSRGKQKDDLLGPGLPIAEGERLLKEFAPSLNWEEIDFIKASSAERKRREHARARQFQVAASILFFLLCAALVGAYFGLTGRAEAVRQGQDAERQKQDAEKQKQDAVTAKDNAVTQTRKAQAAQVEAETARTKEQQIRFSVYKTSYQTAKHQMRNDEALFWLRAAIDLGKQCGLDTRDEELALTGESSRASRFLWRAEHRVPGLRIQQFKSSGDIWACVENTSDVTYHSGFLIGKQDGRGWNFDRSLGGIGNITATAPWNGTNKMLAICDKKLTVINAESLAIEKQYPAEDGGLQPTLYIAPDERSLWVVSGYNLKQLELPSFRLVKEWPLDVPRDAEILDLRAIPESEVAVFRLYAPQERSLAVFDLKGAKTKLELKRQGGFEDEIGADPRHVVFIGSDAPSEIICVDLLDPSKNWRKICPWPGVRVLGLSADDFTIAHSDGNIRHWSYSGELLSKESIAETNNLERIYPVNSGFFLMHDGLFSFRSDLAKSDDSATGTSIVANSIALVGDNDFAVVTTESEIQFRKTADNSLSRKLSLDGDDLVVDEKSNRIFLRKETHLTAYDLKSLEKQGSVEIDGKLPFFISSARGGLVAATSEGVFVFDPRDLGRRELIFDQKPFDLRSAEDGVLLFTKDEGAKRLELWRYRWENASLAGPVTIPCESAQINAVCYDDSSKRLFVGFDGGSASVYSIELPEALQSINVTEQGEKLAFADTEPVTKIWVPDPGTVFIAHADGGLEVATVNEEHLYELVESLSPFGGTDVVQALPTSDGDLLLRASDGRFGRFHVYSHTVCRRTADPSVFGLYKDSCSAFYWYPSGGNVVSVAKDGKETRLKGTKVNSADFQWVVASPSQTTLAAADSEGLIYLWAYDKGEIRDETPVTISVFRWYNYLTFVNDQTLAATSNDGICLIDLSKDLKASIRWVSNALPQNRPVALRSGVALAGDSLFAADEQFNKLFVFDVKSGKCTEMPLAHVPRSLCAAGIRSEFLVVGGDDEATVVNALNKTVDHEIALPARRGDSSSYAVRGSLGIANTDIVLLGAEKEIYFVDVHRGTFFMDQPVNDFVWKIALDQESQSLCWHGNALYGEFPLPRFTETAPEMNWLENAFGKRLVGGSKIMRQISLHLTPCKSE